MRRGCRHQTGMSGLFSVDLDAAIAPSYIVNAYRCLSNDSVRTSTCCNPVVAVVEEMRDEGSGSLVRYSVYFSCLD